MVFDPSAVYRIVENGGPPAIFLLLTFMGLILAGVLRLRREVEAADERFKDQKKVNDELLIRIDRQQALFERSLDLMERQVLPLLESPSQGRRPWRSSRD